MISDVFSLYFSLNSSICTQDDFNLCLCPLNCRQNNPEILKKFFMSIGQLQVPARLNCSLYLKTHLELRLQSILVLEDYIRNTLIIHLF